MKKRSGRLLFLYPFILALASPFSLYLHNARETAFRNAARTLIVAFLLTLVFYFLNRLIYRKARTARAVTALSMLFLVNYGDLSTFGSSHPVFGLDLGDYVFLITFFILLTAVLVMVFKKSEKASANIELFLGFTALAFAAILLVNSVSLAIQSRQKATQASEAQAASTTQANTQDPDIYFIILDTYTSSDVLVSSFGFDNSDFEQQLRDLGFYIPEKSYSNYDGTVQTISSVLNMDFVQSFTDPDTPDPAHTAVTAKSIDNEVRKLLKERGYSIATFTSEYFWLMWRDADHFIEPVRKNFLVAGLTQFEFMAIKKSMLYLLYETSPTIFDVLLFHVGNVGQDKYQEQSFLIENLSEVPEDGRPRFVYAHSTITHYPLLFHADGTMIPLADQGASSDDYAKENVRQSYIETIRYLNSKLVIELSAIIEANPNTVIILQGDHGYPREENKNAIFFAVYDPKGSLNDQACVTPVNVFRRIFNTWFGTQYKYLPDTVYRTPDQSYYRYESLGTCQQQP